jgi:hypothetical protein
LNIAATNAGGNASYVLNQTAFTLNTNTLQPSYSFMHTNTNQNYELVVTQGIQPGTTSVLW